MKKTLLAILSCSVGIISCTIQKPKALDTTIATTPSKEVAEDSTCCFDINTFNMHQGENGNPGQYEFTIKDGKEIRQWLHNPDGNSPETEWAYIEEISKKRSPFVIRKQYDYKGRLKSWVKTFRLEPINKSYEYDEKGNVVKVTDYEKIYKHSFADIREFLLKEKGIDIYDTRQAIARRVNHELKVSPDAYYQIFVIKGLKYVSEGYYIIIKDSTLEMDVRK